MSNNPDPAVTAPDRGRRWFWRLVTLLIVLIGIGGFVALQVFKPRPEVRPLVRQLPVVRTIPAEILDDPLPVRGQGLVSPRTQVTLAAEISARITSLHPQMVAGGRFRRGECLVELDAEPVRAALAQTRADFRASEAQLRLAEQSVQRTRELIAQGFLSRQTLDEREASRDQAAAALERARAALRQRAIDLERTCVLAPFDGRVLSEQINAGDTVQPGRELARIFDDSALEVTASLTDSDIAMIDNPFSPDGPRAAARVEVDHGGIVYRWPARLARVEAAIDPTSRTFNVVVAVDDPRQRGQAPSDDAPPGPPLLVGMYADVQIDGRDQGPYLLLPASAVREGSRVWRLDGQDRLQVVPVRVLGERNDRIAVAATPFQNGQRIVVSDLRVVTEGMPVRRSDTETSGSDARTRRDAAGARTSDDRTAGDS
ncbi:MAG: efflux RND transporter periplasmic adaptor subunit [Burkholderiaceae bacterium]